MSSDRIALVTGAARGQGAAIVKRLSKDGFRVAACDLLVDDLNAAVEALGNDTVIAISLDVTDAAQWATAVASTVERFGALTTLVNNAGVLHRASLADETPAGFEGSWRVNCLGPFLGIRAALPQLREARGCGDREHLQHRGHPAVPQPRSLRLGEMGAAGSDPSRRSRIGGFEHSRERGVSRPGRDADAR